MNLKQQISLLAGLYLMLSFYCLMLHPATLFVKKLHIKLCFFVFFFLSFLTPKCLLQVEEGGRASLAGVQDGDEVVSINGEPCADLTLLQAFALIDTSIDCLQLLVRR